MKFLIVDDDERMILLLGKYLAEYATCVTARDGERAIEIFTGQLDESDPFTAVFMDFMMPGMNGNETVKRMRSVEKARGLDGPGAFRLFMVSAKCDLKVVSESFFQCGADGYLVKPFSRDDLRRLLLDNNVIERGNDGELAPSPWTSAPRACQIGQAPAKAPNGPETPAPEPAAKN
jgi:two-component system, chemotaxis family, chemotaxis protein CheY